MALPGKPITADPDLMTLLEKAKAITMTPEQEDAQMRSFVIGQTMMANPHLTRDYVTGLVVGCAAQLAPPNKVTVTASDYSYDGWLVCTFNKRGGATRYVVEDQNGRLFIHNAKQLGLEE